MLRLSRADNLIALLERPLTLTRPDRNERRVLLTQQQLPAMLVSLCRVILPLSSTSLKAGQPHPASNFVLELKSSWRQTMQT